MTSRVGLPISCWLPSEREYWDRVILPKLTADKLRKGSIIGYFYTYALWLRHIRRYRAVEEEFAPFSNIDADFGQSWLGEIRRRTTARSTLMYAHRLKKLLLTADQAADIEWLERTLVELRSASRSAPELAKHVIDARRLFLAGLGLMDRGRDMLVTPCPSSVAMRGREAYRDGLMIALLAVRPFRLRNLARLKLQTNLILGGKIAWFRFGGSDTKTGVPLEVPFPNALFQNLLFYVGSVRRDLPNASRSPDLWISSRGVRLTDHSVTRIIRARTSEAFGTPVSPHAFRQAAVTFLAAEHPDMINLAADLLGHIDSRITERYYNRAPAQAGAKALQTNLLEAAGETAV